MIIFSIMQTMMFVEKKKRIKQLKSRYVKGITYLSTAGIVGYRTSEQYVIHCTAVCYALSFTIVLGTCTGS